MAEDDVTAQTLALATQKLVEAATPLSALLRPQAARIAQEMPHLPLHSVLQLLLTAGQVSRPELLDHAVQAMALAGALMATQGGSTAELRLAMLAGLRHDLGEMHIDARCGEADADRNQPALQAILETDDVQARLARLDGALRLAGERADALATSAASSTLKSAAEVASVKDALFFRLRSIERATRLRAGELPAAEALQWQALCDTLGSTAL